MEVEWSWVRGQEKEGSRMILNIMRAVIVGDLNYPDVNWADAMYTTPTSGKFIYLRIYFLIIMVRKVSDEETLYI